MIFLVLGGSGFIGSNFVYELLEHRHKIIVFDKNITTIKHKHLHFVKGNIHSSICLKNLIKKSDIIVHAFSSINPTTSIKQYKKGYLFDIKTSVEIFNLAAKLKKRVIYLSSGGTVYGEQKTYPVSETTSFGHLTNHYAIVKATIDRTAIMFKEKQGADILIARISNPFGGYLNCTSGAGFIDVAIKRAISKLPIIVYGDGNTIRDYIDVKDVCALLYKMSMYKGKKYIFNISSGYGTTQNEIIKIIRDNIKNVSVNHLPFRSIDLKCSILDNSLIKKVFSYHPSKIDSLVISRIKQLKRMK